MPRPDGRAADELRPLKLTRNYLDYAKASVLVEWGRNKILCAASVSDTIPSWLVGRQQGWVTAEYSMLPVSSKQRVSRGPSPRSTEIQRLIARSLRAVVDLKALGEQAICIDCDVIQADGGTRTAAITGAMVALYETLQQQQKAGRFKQLPLRDFVAAVSVGLVGGEVLTDLCYREDYDADVDMNVVMTSGGEYVELQGTAEEKPFSAARLDELLAAARQAIGQISAVQKAALELA